MNWIELSSEDQIKQLKQDSFGKPVLVFKHSTRCSTSSVALNRLERSWNLSAEAIDIYFLDLISHRSISNLISSEFNIRHESPQVLLIRGGECIYDASHMLISAQEIEERVATLA